MPLPIIKIKLYILQNIPSFLTGQLLRISSMALLTAILIVCLRLSAMVEASGAKSTDMMKPEDVQELSAKCEDDTQNWAIAADRLWVNPILVRAAQAAAKVR